MSALHPIAVYGLTVPAGDVMVPALTDLQATFRITMAAIDPSAPPKHSGTANGDVPARATLKIIYDPTGPLEDDDDSSQDSDERLYMESLIQDDDEDESDSEEEGKNGGPSDPSKRAKARKQAAAEQMIKAIAENDSDNDMSIDGGSGINGVVSKINKGKGKATEDDEGDSDAEHSADGLDELVLCTLDPDKNYQQPLDITIGENQLAYFKVSGTHTIYLTGNYLVAADDGHNRRHEIYGDEDDEEDYDFSPDEGELAGSESDELDDLEDPRITELASEDDEVPKLAEKGEAGRGKKEKELGKENNIENLMKLSQKEEPVKGNKKEESGKGSKKEESGKGNTKEDSGKGNKKEESGKGNKKRAAEDSENEPTNLDDIMAKAMKPAESNANGEPKLSKKQLKKLKNNAGKAVEAAIENKTVEKVEEAVKDKANGKVDKKVQFAKHLEQGPSSPANDKSTKKSETKTDSKKDGEKPKATLGLKNVQGVDVDDKKLGKGPAAKQGSKVSMRYIGKLQDGKVFDSNKKGPAFTFTLGSGDVIKGWDIGVLGMSVGGERRITIPPHLAYGNKAKPGIPANSRLVFDVKVLEIK